MTEIEKRNLVAQWAFDTRPVLLRFHLWLDDVEVERAQQGAVSDVSFIPRGIARCLAMTSAATALGTRLFGGRPPASRWYRIPWRDVADVGVTLRLGVRCDGLEVTWVERWLRDHVVGRVPGGRHDPQ